MLRHIFPHRWLSTGGTELDLMRIGGRSKDTLKRYGAAGAGDCVVKTHRRTGLGYPL